MENLGGGLGFRATLDIDDFKVSADTMESYFKKTSKVSEAEVAKMEAAYLQFAETSINSLKALETHFGANTIEEKIAAIQKILRDNEESVTQLGLSYQEMSRKADEAFANADLAGFDAANDQMSTLKQSMLELIEESRQYKLILQSLGETSITGTEGLSATKLFSSQGAYEEAERLKEKIVELQQQIAQFDGSPDGLVSLRGELTRAVTTLSEVEGTAAVAAASLGTELGGKAAEASEKLYKLNAALKKQENTVADLSDSVKKAADELSKLKEEQADSTTIDSAIIKYDTLRQSLNAAQSELYNLQAAQQDASVQWASVSREVESHSNVLVKLLGGQEKYNEIMSRMPPALQSAASGISGMTGAAKAFIATPLGLIIAALALALESVYTWLNSTVEGQKKLAEISGYVSGVLGQFKEVVIKVGEVLFKAFSDPKQAVKDLWEAIKNSLMNRVEAVGEAFGALGRVIKSALDWDGDGVKEGLKDMAKSWAEFMTGVEDVTDKVADFVSTTKSAAEETAKIRREAKELEIAVSEWSKTNATLEGKKQEARAKMYDSNASKAERQKALEEYKNIIETQRKQEAAFADQRIELQKREMALTSNTIENENKLRELEAARINVDTKAKSELAMLQHRSNGITNDTDAEKVAQKQQDADFKLEAARISILEEGYEKRKATLDLQHKQNLARIEREEKELEMARKKAGEGGLSDTEKQDFEQRRTYENQSYDKAQTKLFDGELEYKRKQYELYWSWVDSMGREVADKEFANLLQSGGSYKEYIEKQIAELNEKKQAGTLTDSENKFLYTLSVNLEELNGGKTALERFNEEIERTMNRSQTLAEKLKAVADAKKKLENGDSGLNADDRSKAYTKYDKQEADLQKQVQETVLKDYRTFEEQRNSIAKEYALLRTEAEKMGDEERVRLINKAEQDALSALNASMLMQSDSWKNLFSDLDALAVDKINELVTKIQEKMNTADLNLNPADLKAVLDRLDEARNKILDTNPFKAMGSAISNVFTTSKNGAKKSSEEIKRDWNNLASATEGCFEFVNDAIDSCSVLSDLIGDSGKMTIQLLQDVAMAGIAMATAIKTAEKASIILTAISVALQAVSWIATIFNNDAKHEEKIQSIQRSIDALERSCDRLKSAFDRTYWVFTDEEKAAYDDRVKALEEQIELQQKLAYNSIMKMDLRGYAEAMAKIKELNKELSKAKESGDMLSIYEEQRKALENQKELIQRQIEEQQAEKNPDEDKITEWKNKIEDIDDQLADMERSMIETFAGTDVKSAIDEFADAIVDAYCAGEDAAKALGETTKSVLKNAVIEALKRNFLAKGINDAVNFLGEAMSDGELTSQEKAKFEAMANAAGETFTTALESLGDWIKDIDDEATNADPLTGAVTSMSEETGGVIAGRLNAFIINQTEQTNVMREQLLQQSAIAQNTATANTILTRIDETLRRIETKDNSLLSQGIS